MREREIEEALATSPLLSDVRLVNFMHRKFVHTLSGGNLNSKISWMNSVYINGTLFFIWGDL